MFNLATTLNEIIDKISFRDTEYVPPTISFRHFRQWVESLPDGTDLGNPSDPFRCPVQRFVAHEYPAAKVQVYCTHVNIDNGIFSHNDQTLSNFISKAMDLSYHLRSNTLTKEDVLWLMTNTSKYWNYIPAKRLGKYLAAHQDTAWYDGVQR